MTKLSSSSSFHLVLFFTLIVAALGALRGGTKRSTNKSTTFRLEIAGRKGGNVLVRRLHEGDDHDDEVDTYVVATPKGVDLMDDEDYREYDEEGKGVVGDDDDDDDGWYDDDDDDDGKGVYDDDDDDGKGMMYGKKGSGSMAKKGSGGKGMMDDDDDDDDDGKGIMYGKKGSSGSMAKKGSGGKGIMDDDDDDDDDGPGKGVQARICKEDCCDCDCESDNGDQVCDCHCDCDDGNYEISDDQGLIQCYYPGHGGDDEDMDYFRANFEGRRHY